jgi:protein-disulfide isomerase
MTLQRKKIDRRDWVRGSPQSPITLIEYGDFECPFCGAAYWELKRLEAVVGDRIAFVFRNFPLSQMHPHAQLAAEAAEAAGAQGRFWEMHDMLFENQQQLEASALLTYAGELQLDLRRFARDLQTHVHAPKVRSDFMEGVRSGVNGTPTMFLNGELYEGPHSAEALLAAIEGRHVPGIEPMTRTAIRELR